MNEESKKAGKRGSANLSKPSRFSSFSLRDWNREWTRISEKAPERNSQISVHWRSFAVALSFRSQLKPEIRLSQGR
jgi:hypothetical protein